MIVDTKDGCKPTQEIGHFYPINGIGLAGCHQILVISQSIINLFFSSDCWRRTERDVLKIPFDKICRA
jgi:hypothetical protein